MAAAADAAAAAVEGVEVLLLALVVVPFVEPGAGDCVPSTPASLGVSPSLSSFNFKRALRSRSRSSSWRLNFLPIRKSRVRSDILSFCRSTTWSSASSGVRERARRELDRDPVAVGVLVLRFRGAGVSVPSCWPDAFRWRFLGREGSPSGADVVASAPVVDGLLLALVLMDALEAEVGSSEAVADELCVSIGGAVALAVPPSSDDVDCSGVSIEVLGGGLAAD